MVEFRPWPKTPRLFADAGCIVTEKIDGTNGCIIVTDDGEVYAASRKRLLPMGPRGLDDTTWEKDDHYGFAAWVRTHREILKEILGPGYHYGEWWGNGINRGYGLQKGDRRFSLFNTERWRDLDVEELPELKSVPILFEGSFSTNIIGWVLDDLLSSGSHAAPGFLRPEGVCVYHKAAKQIFKVPFGKDDYGLAA